MSARTAIGSLQIAHRHSQFSHPRAGECSASDWQAPIKRPATAWSGAARRLNSGVLPTLVLHPPKRPEDQPTGPSRRTAAQRNEVLGGAQIEWRGVQRCVGRCNVVEDGGGVDVGLDVGVGVGVRCGVPVLNPNPTPNPNPQLKPGSIGEGMSRHAALEFSVLLQCEFPREPPPNNPVSVAAQTRTHGLRFLDLDLDGQYSTLRFTSLSSATCH